jgi:cerevisin
MRGIISAVALAAAVSAAPSISIGTIHRDAAPILDSSNADVIPNAYIIKFKKHVGEAAASDHHSWVQQIHSDRTEARLELRKRGLDTLTDDVLRGLKHTYKISESFLGYSGHFDEETIEMVRRHPDVRPTQLRSPRRRIFC